ncbi:hypothetical protein CH373_13220 [Leptospira perolatii]|uniref:Uncharacterized protein n=1 Tax=Leptospira perolatii TaxID=2023191 RepID=A0A2M9ZL47_9LEPT|nr:hypothetical protein [Leptospira perolatii]PJZ69929.1 hypothetical protein CH360_08465 [Leptospira perolatii]PJZ72663.1 hypothetical protein CH373_13220 [Leptospira perolatii]
MVVANHQDRIEIVCGAGIANSKPCPANCRSEIRNGKGASDPNFRCLAYEKLARFLEGKNSFTVGITAFQQAPAEVLENFSAQSDIGFELVRYFLSISSHEEVKSTILEMSDPLLYRIVSQEFTRFIELRKTKKGSEVGFHFLDIRSNDYWIGLPPERIVKFIEYSVKGERNTKLASQFLKLLSDEMLLDLQSYAELSEDDERELYLGLQDAIYEFPLVMPGIYQHLLSLFQENPEIHIVLSTMEALVERKAVLMQAGKVAIRLLTNASGKNTHQMVLDYLQTLDADAALEILAMLEERRKLSRSEKEMLASYIKKSEN